uniref:Translocation and assembly module subunit TamA n=1 Tax=uncultured Thiotrichaceae bacterium TaxID=298394 RepID=A0A6S6UIL9_9GAMM|nr:MAG: Outer membrane protein assembly factor YaeT precursor [uncultured Thiotrichaceae bacterium]
MVDKANRKRLSYLSVVMLAGSSGLYAADKEEADALINLDTSPVEVEVTGAPDELADNLKAYLPSLATLVCDSDKERVERFIDASDEKLIEGAEAMGYFDSRFKMTPVRNGGCWQLNIAVEPGTPVRIDQQTIDLVGEGGDLGAFKDVVTDKPYQQGDIFVNSHYEDFKSSLDKTANKLGFFDAEYLKRRVLVNVDTHKADIELEYKTGQRYKFGEVGVTQDVLSDRFMERYLRVEEGQTYDSDVLLEQRRLLESSGYYKDVEVRTQFDAAENAQVPVEITATRRDRYSYTATLGYATDTDFRFETGMEAHWVNHRGHKLTGKLRLAQKDPALGFVYKVPLWDPENEYASFAFDWALSDNDDIKGEKLELELNYNRQNDSGWKQTAFVTFLDEKTQVDGSPEVHSQLTLPGARVSKTERDDALFPTKGWRVRAEVQGSYEGILSDVSLLQGSIEGKYLYTFDHKGKVIARGSLGSSWTDEFSALPKSLRFFAGGQSSVRGYDFESIGETDADGNVIGGKHLIVASGEYEYPVAEKISLAAFVDAGASFDEWNDYGFGVGYGVGARYKSPLGPIRFDLAVPDDDPSDLHFYFSLGPDL